jgi:hypothetical protein
MYPHPIARADMFGQLEAEQSHAMLYMLSLHDLFRFGCMALSRLERFGIAARLASGV